MTTGMMDQWVGLSTAYAEPALRMNQVSAETLERIGQLQSRCLEDCIECGTQQLRVFGDSHGPEDFFAKETDIIKDYMGRVQAYSQEALTILMNTQRAFGECVQEGLRSAGAEKATKATQRTAGAAKATKEPE